MRRLRSYLRAWETLEPRALLTLPPTLTIPLDPTLDQFGDQIVSVQAYGDSSRTAFGIFDTGASAVTFSADDQAIFSEFVGSPIPIKVFGGAQGDGIGGSVVGDVSQPGTIFADGMHAADLTFDSQGFPVFNFAFSPTSATTTGIQAFVGTQDGSPDLPSITGTPILYPTPENPHGYAALVDMQGAQLDFSDVLPGLVLSMPDLHFVDPSTTIAAATGTTDPVRISLTPYGNDNHTNPGDAISESPNQTQVDVSVVNGSTTLTHQNFLFDTGAQLTVVSTAVAQALGLDLSHPTTTITVEGVGGSEDVPGFTIPELDIPRSDGGVLQFTNVPIYVLDVAPDISGILGMNLLDTASTLLFNPLDQAGPSLNLTFFTDPNRGGGVDNSALDLLKSKNVPFTGTIHGHSLPGFVAPSAPVHEATTGDYDGDHKADLGVFRPGAADWLIQQSSTGHGQVTQFGAPSGDQPLQADFDGDGRNDLALYRPSTGQWFLKESSGATKVISFGQAGVDLPVPGDYDGDGKADLAVYRPTTGQWFILGSSAGPMVRQFGAANLDIPEPGAYDGGTTTEIAVYRPTTAEWFILGPSGGRKLQFGATTDIPVPGDYDGDGKTDLAVYRPSTAQWFIRGSALGGRVVQFGAPGTDQPIPADYDGDGKVDIAVFRPSTAQWFLDESTGVRTAEQFGEPGVDVPLTLSAAIRLAGMIRGDGGIRAASASRFSPGQAIGSTGASTWESVLPNSTGLVGNELVIIPPPEQTQTAERVSRGQTAEKRSDLLEPSTAHSGE